MSDTEIKEYLGMTGIGKSEEGKKFTSEFPTLLRENTDMDNDHFVRLFLEKLNVNEYLQEEAGQKIQRLKTALE